MIGEPLVAMQTHVYIRACVSVSVYVMLTEDPERLEGEDLTDYNNEPAGIRAMFYRSFKGNGYDE